MAHEGKSRAQEGVEVLGGIIESLLTGDVRWTDFDGETRPLTADDVHVIAPYKLQVAA